MVCARTAAGQGVCYPPVENEHRRHILDVSTVPADISPQTARQAVELASAIAESAADMMGSPWVHAPAIVGADHRRRGCGR